MPTFSMLFRNATYTSCRSSLCFRQANEEVIAEWTKSEPFGKIMFQSSLCGRMQRNQATLAELRVPNDEAVLGDVLHS
jgi:hypothetical protein